MRRPLQLVLVLVLPVSLLSGCGVVHFKSSEQSATKAAATETAPVVTTAPPAAATKTTLELPTSDWQKPAAPVQKAGARTPLGDLKYDLEKQVIAAAGVDKPTTTTCNPANPDLSKAQTITCTVTYEGVSAPFTVELAGGTYFISYKSRADALPLTKEKAEHSFKYDINFYKDVTAASCDIKPVQLVDLDRSGAFSCTMEKADGTKKIYRAELSRYGNLMYTA